MSTTKKQGVGYSSDAPVVWIDPFSNKTYTRTLDPTAHPWDPADLRSCETGVGRGGVNMDLFYQRYGVSKDEQDQFKGLNPQGFTNEDYFRNVCTLKGMYVEGQLGSEDEWDGGPTFEEGTDFSFQHSKNDPLYSQYDCSSSNPAPDPTSDCPPSDD